jgi:hypothetical protein
VRLVLALEEHDVTVAPDDDRTGSRSTSRTVGYADWSAFGAARAFVDEVGEQPAARALGLLRDGRAIGADHGRSRSRRMPIVIHLPARGGAAR